MDHSYAITVLIIAVVAIIEAFGQFGRIIKCKRQRGSAIVGAMIVAAAYITSLMLLLIGLTHRATVEYGALAFLFGTLARKFDVWLKDHGPARNPTARNEPSPVP
jgi:hypothetical protein